MTAQQSAHRVRGKVALVTGAARGIGRSIAQRLAGEGAVTFVTDILAAELNETEAIIAHAGGTVHSLIQDVTDPDSWRSVVASIGQSTVSPLRLDILVNNAGRCAIRSIEESSLAEWRETMSINLDSVFLALHHCLPLLRASAAASVVNLSSTGAMVGVPGLAAYTAAKGAIRALTKTAAIEFAQRGYPIRVNSVHPGPTDTDRAVSLMAQAYSLTTEGVRTEGGKALPLGRLGMPADIANAVLFLASEESAWVTGSELVVDGGDIAR
jgi:NAD(P)-dependent dehydrogenase (short-subunit alcohol dehydrogenase family)